VTSAGAGSALVAAGPVEVGSAAGVVPPRTVMSAAMLDGRVAPGSLG